MKNYIISLLQKLLGYERYLFVFAKMKIRFLKFNRRKDTYRHFKNLIPEDSTVAVIGASVGITTLPIANGKREIFAYEPIPSNVSIIEKLKKKLNAQKLSIFSVALGNHSGQVEFIFPRINGAKKHGLSYVKNIHIDGQPKGETLTIEIDKFDNRPELIGKKIGALKIVAENYEFEIFSGAKETIKRDRPIIYCELWDNAKRAVVLEFIRSMNYEVSILMNGKLESYSDHQSTYSGKHFIFRSHS